MHSRLVVALISAAVSFAALPSSAAPLSPAPPVALEPVHLRIPGIWPPPDLEVRVSGGILSVDRPSRNGVLIIGIRKPSGEMVEDNWPKPKYGAAWTGAIDGRTQTFTVHLQGETATLTDSAKTFLWSGPNRIFSDKEQPEQTLTIDFTGEPGTVEIRDGNRKWVKTLAAEFVRVDVRDESGQPANLPFSSMSPQKPQVKLAGPGTAYVTYRDKNDAFVESRKMTLFDTGELFAAPCDESGKKIGYTYKSFTALGFRAKGRK